MGCEDADPMSENGPAQKFNNEVSSDIIDFVDTSKNGSFYLDRNQKSSDQRPVSITRTQYTTSMLSHALFSLTKQRECIDSTTAENSRSHGHLQQRAACKLPENVVISPPQHQDNNPTPDLPGYPNINHLAKKTQTQPLSGSRSFSLPQMLHRTEAPIHVLASFQQREAADAHVAPWTRESYEKRLAEDVAATDARLLSNNDHHEIYDPSFSNVHAQRKRQRRKFCDRVEELRLYKMKHGHLRVSSKEDPSLFKFCTKIRCIRRHPGKEMRKLSSEQIESLDAIGFDWRRKSHQMSEDDSAQSYNSKASSDRDLVQACISFNLDRNLLSHELSNPADESRCNGHVQPKNGVTTQQHQNNIPMPDLPDHPDINPLAISIPAQSWTDNMSSSLTRMSNTTEARRKNKLGLIALRALAALKSSNSSSSSEDEDDLKDSQDLLSEKSKESCGMNSVPSEMLHTSLRMEAPLVAMASAWSQAETNASLSPAPSAVMQLVTIEHSILFNKCCRHNLKPAQIPRDPLDDNWDGSVALEKEIAWLVEESKVLLPTSASDILSENKLSLPIVLDFAWRHGSFELREKMRDALQYKWNGVEGNTVTDLTLVDGIDLIKSCTGSQPDPGSEEIIRLRKEACSALQLGYRRSECIERDLNEIQGLRWRQAVEEVGEPGDGKGPLPTNKCRQRRKPPTNAALLQAAEHSLVSPSCSQSDAEVASQIPSLLTPLEDEIAWLAEESLILLPRDMIDNRNASSTDSTKIESMVSAGLITQCEINWEYVTRNASDNLKDELVRIGGIKRRPLQRIVRWQQKEVKVAFQKRRSDISLLLLRGYRRHETKLSVPSHELLVETGLFNVWAVRQMRRRQNEVAEEGVSTNDLRLACNQRLGNTHQTAKSPKRKKCLSHTSITPTKSHVAKLAFVKKARSSTLTAEEEEIAWVSGRVNIAWLGVNVLYTNLTDGLSVISFSLNKQTTQSTKLREEYEFETGIKCYDWNYIEEKSSPSLLTGLAENSCAPSSFPSSPGISRLRTMVRLAIPSFEESFERKRIDIRYAIAHGGFRRDRSADYLPEISAAPASFDPLFVRKNGTSVLAIEYPCAQC